MALSTYDEPPNQHWLFTPPVPVDGVALRRDVLERLSSPSVRVGVVIAPAGYGKTSHAAALVAQDARPVAWLDIEPQHDGPSVLLTSLMAALSSVTDFDRGDISAVGGGPDLYMIGLAAAFGRTVRRCIEPFVLVLDDIHLLHGTSATDVIAALISNVPAGSTVLLIGRACQLDVLHRLRVNSDVVDIRPEDLALDRVGVATVLAGFGVDASAEQVGEVIAETEGWPVGVRLAGLAMLADADADADADGGNPAAPAVSGRDPLVSDYIDTEWLWGLSDDERSFLQRVSVLDWLSGPLCNAVTGRNDAGEMLRSIHENRLLVISLDHRSGSYRMHGLLREALVGDLERIDAPAVRQVHLRASAWFESAADIERAIRHALAADDVDRAERLIIEYAPALYPTGQFATITRWVESMPQSKIRHSAPLCLCGALGAMGVADDHAVAGWLNLGDLAALSAPESNHIAQLQLRHLRSTISPGPALPAADEAGAAYRGLPPGAWHAGTCSAYGAWLWMVGDDSAADILAEGAEEAALFGAPSMQAACSAMLAIIAHSEGHPARAWVLADRAHRLAAEHDLLQGPYMAIVNAVHALATAAAGDPESSRAGWQLARTQLAALADISGWMNVQTRVALAHASLLLGDKTGAQTMVRELSQLLVNQPDAARAHRQLAEIEEHAGRLRHHSAIGASSLTTAELRVLHYLPTNLSLAEIGDRLFVSRYTIKTHCSSIYRKLDATTRSGAVAAARAVGLLSGETSLDQT